MIENYKQTSHWLFLPILACLVAILPLSTTGYLAVRLVVSLSALYAVFLWDEPVRIEIKFIFLFVAILFNPIFPVILHSKVAWIFIDILVAALFFSQLKKNPKDLGDNEGLNAISLPSSVDFQRQTVDQQRMIKNGDLLINVVKPLSLAYDSAEIVDERMRADAHLRRWFLGYCCGFVIHAQNPSAAFSFERSGMWVKQSYFGMLESSVPTVLDEVVDAETKSLFLELFSIDILFDNEWEDGYGYGVRDAEFWVESGAITQSLIRRLRKV